jgi:hypothetical protein
VSATATSLFSLDNLAVFERHGATVDSRGGRSGCWVRLPNGWVLSVQWGGCMYGSNYDERAGADVPPATTAEIAAWREGEWEPSRGGLVQWADGDTVQGWCSMERVLHVLDLMAEDKLLRVVSADATVACDDWREVSS